MSAVMWSLGWQEISSETGLVRLVFFVLICV